MGSSVAPKMFSQPGVFGTSDTTAVVNKTNPMAGLAVGPATQPSTVALLNNAQNSTPVPASVVDNTSKTPFNIMRWTTNSSYDWPGAGDTNDIRSRSLIAGTGAFYGN